MNIADIILKDVVMVGIYDCPGELILIDLSNAVSIADLLADDYGQILDNTLLINDSLPFLVRDDLVRQITSEYLNNHMLEVNKQYNSFSTLMRMQKMRALARTYSLFIKFITALNEAFKANNLYNNCGLLKTTAIDADVPSCSIAAIGGDICHQNLMRHFTFSTSQTSLGYLEKILTSI